MEKHTFELTKEQQGLLASLALETGKPMAALLDEALERLHEPARGGHDRATHEPAECLPTAAPRQPFWQKALEASQRIPDAELDHLPPDLAAQVDHYIYGTPKR